MYMRHINILLFVTCLSSHAFNISAQSVKSMEVKGKDDIIIVDIEHTILAKSATFDNLINQNVQEAMLQFQVPPHV